MRIHSVSNNRRSTSGYQSIRDYTNVKIPRKIHISPRRKSSFVGSALQKSISSNCDWCVEGICDEVAILTANLGVRIVLSIHVYAVGAGKN